MKTIDIGKSGLQASEIILGCMRIDKMSEIELSKYIQTALNQGINMFDHADIYGGGYCEELFGKVIKNEKRLRNQIKLQSKCSIRDGYYDLSKEHILNSVDNILKRLQTDYLDAFILHRPDTLMEVEEIASAFDILESSGKVLKFGVSNFNSMQIELLKTCVKQDIILNQLQFGVMHANMISSGIQANTNFEGAVDKDKAILEYSRINNITIQAWSPLQYGFFEGIFVDNEKFKTLNDTLAKIANDKGVSKSALVVAWILRHPAKMQVVLGTTNTQRLIDMCMASNIELSRKEWYEIYTSAGNILP